MTQHAGVHSFVRLLAGTTLCASLAMSTQVRAQRMPDGYMDKIRAAETSIGQLEEFEKMGSLSAAQRAELKEGRAHRLQWLGTARSLAGDADGAARAFAWWTQIYHDRRSTETLPDNATAEDAIEAIVRQARKHQVVILNESHHIPLQRVFAARLAHELRKLGFEYLACETFAESPFGPASSSATPARNARVTQRTGFYSMEPTYGQFLRSAIRDGWQFVSYDTVALPEASFEVRHRVREEGAVDNLVKRIFLKDPKAKVFIFVGLSHAAERLGSMPGQQPWLAELLTRRTGIDPLTIDQATMFGYPEQAAEHALYRPALAKFPWSRAFVLHSGGQRYEVFGRYRGQMDMQVFHPDEGGIEARTGRPRWMSSQAGLQARDIPAELLPKQGRRLIQAFEAADGPDGVPVDMVMVEAGKQPPKLMLPAGEFRYAYEE